MNFNAPAKDEGMSLYVHDPDDPVKTCGGGNMLINVPDGSRDSDGSMNLNNPEWAYMTMNHKGVLQFESDEVLESNGYPGDSLCIIGYPVATIQAQTDHGNTFKGLTNTEFYVRVLDVYPDGREFFVVEGGVNARQREYARSIAEGNRNPDAPISNIRIGEQYEYKFQLMPIAHTFAKGHKIKILLSSSNHPRYQSCPNIPIEDGEFFRRYPNDGRTYTFRGKEMSPRIAIQRIHFSNKYGESSTNIELPVYGLGSGKLDPLAEVSVELEALVLPNPAENYFSVYMNRNSKFTWNLFDGMGRQVKAGEFESKLDVDATPLKKGVYFLEILESETGLKTAERVVVE